MPRAARGRGRGRGRGRRRFQGPIPTTPDELDDLSKDELIAIIGRLQHTVRRRGGQIQGLYWALEQSLRNHPDAEQMPNNSAALEEQLTAARQRIRALMDLAANNADNARRQQQAADQRRRVTLGCNVCWQTMTDGARQPMALMCGHVYCRTCVGNILDGNGANQCPSCRTDMGAYIPLFINANLEINDSDTEEDVVEEGEVHDQPPAHADY